MKPVKSLTGGITITLLILLTLSFIAASVPESIAKDAPDTSPILKHTSATGSVGLQLEISPVRNNTGKVIVLVFDDQGAYSVLDVDRAVGFAEIPAESGTLRKHFPELQSGPYAVTLFHDENDDYDLNMDGIYPIEGYGTTGAKDAYHEPTFDEASVDAGAVSVQVYYLN